MIETCIDIRIRAVHKSIIAALALLCQRENKNIQIIFPNDEIKLLLWREIFEKLNSERNSERENQQQRLMFFFTYFTLAD